MTDEQIPQDPSAEGPPPSDTVAFGTEPASPGRDRRRRAGRAVLWIAVGAIGATVLSGVAFAASRTTPTPTPSAGPSNRHGGPGMTGGPGPGGGFSRGPMGATAGGPGGSLLHGDLVLKGKDGKTKDVLVQNGAITGRSGTSITVKSTDGFTATWTLGSTTVIRTFAAKQATGTASDLAVNDTVLVAGTKTTDTSGDALLVRVPPTKAQLKTLLKNAPRGRMHWGGGGPAGAVPAPTGTASGRTTADQLGVDPLDLGSLGA